ncbi:unnamed protein product [Diatraea saccharalis]|uniref:Peptidase S1 domain-containing protein n=1 Tax=Diatraea saccharalis TaxID=40085 RepID=A0A9N9R4Z7_9NEOP|nr:unnamed protein product [Diatraea saccharalis]
MSMVSRWNTSLLHLPGHSDVFQGCGWRQNDGLSERITEDDDVIFGEYPWVVAIFKYVAKTNSYEYCCVGSLIHHKVVLTVKHHFKKPARVRVRAGDWDIVEDYEIYNHQTSDVANIIGHPKYKPRNPSTSSVATKGLGGAVPRGPQAQGALESLPENLNRTQLLKISPIFKINMTGTNEYDAALLILATSINLAPNVAFACLPSASHATPSGTRCHVTGWGYDTFYNGSIQNILKRVEVPVVGNAICQQQISTALSKSITLSDSMMCAGGEKGKDACLKDGGAPLVCPYEDQRERYYQAGIVSWGVRCGLPNVSGVYTSVAMVRDWIDSTMIELKYESTYLP